MFIHTMTRILGRPIVSGSYGVGRVPRRERYQIEQLQRTLQKFPNIKVLRIYTASD